MTDKHLTKTVAATVEHITEAPYLIDAKGNRLPITGEVYTSSFMGMTAIEVEHGTLYADPDETVTVPTAHAIPRTKPASPATLKRKYEIPGDEDTIVVSILVDLDDLLDGDIDHLNNIADHAIVRSHCSLMDLSYEVTGHQDGQIVLTVTADASEIFAEHLCVNFAQCEGLIDDGEGWNGECGDCADRTYRAEHGDEDEQDETSAGEEN